MKIQLHICVFVLSIAISSACSNENSSAADAGIADTVAGGQAEVFDCTSQINDFAASGELTMKPLFENSVVSTDFDFIIVEDPSEFLQTNFTGRSEKEMPDKRSSP